MYANTINRITRNLAKPVLPDVYCKNATEDDREGVNNFRPELKTRRQVLGVLY